MKHSLPLLMLTGLLFGQDVLHLKSGESYNGTFIRRLGFSSVVFQVEGENDSTKFPMKDVAIIKTGYGFELESELTYPFNPNNKRFSVLKKKRSFRLWGLLFTVDIVDEGFIREPHDVDNGVGMYHR